MKYAALLRGINVGGNNIIKMALLKECFEKNGYMNVLTYIQSGNVIFETELSDKEKLTTSIEKLLSKTFNYTSRIVLRTHNEMKKVVNEVPKDWNIRTDLRCYVAFIKEPITVKQVSKEIELKKGIDFKKEGPGVLYLTTLLNSLTKSSLNKLPSKKIYQDMTIRNYNTTKKILALMEKE